MTKSNERRKEQRIPLDTLYFVNISFYQEKNIEDILDCSSKEDFTWEDKNYIIFSVNG